MTTERASMPNRRCSWRRKFKFPANRPGAISYFGTVSFFPSPNGQENEGTAREIFIDTAKVTSGAHYQAEAAAIYASFALQYGCPLAALVEACPRDENNQPAEPVGAFLEMVAKGEVA